MNYQTDFLVVGSGIAGLSYALHVADYGYVTVITKNKVEECDTVLAQGGIAAKLNANDSFESHVEDTLKAGDGLCYKEGVELIVKNAPKEIKWLYDLGVPFNITENKEFDLGREGGHSFNRIVHAGDITGENIEKVLYKQAIEHPNIRILEHFYAIDLITDYHLHDYSYRNIDNISCYGVYVYNINTKKIHKIISKFTILATGGIGDLYKYTTNWEGTIGDGIAIAFRAGAEVMNLEFVQFHPTAFYEKEKEGRIFLISEAVRGFGGKIIDHNGNDLMENVHPLGSLAPRDIVARTIDKYLKKTGYDNAFIKIENRTKKEIINRFPKIYSYCLSKGVDITKDPIPIVPAAHYLCGGIKTDLWGKTKIRNLFAIGETAATGVHGANRLASNSLLEALVFAERAAQYTIEKVKEIKLPSIFNIPDWRDNNTFNIEEWILIKHDEDDIKGIMWDYVGIVRSNERLEKALARLQLILNELNEFYKKTKINCEILQLRNMATVAHLIVQSALSRKESRGLHFNIDYPYKSKKIKNTIISKQF